METLRLIRAKIPAGNKHSANKSSLMPREIAPLLDSGLRLLTAPLRPSRPGAGKIKNAEAVDGHLGPEIWTSTDLKIFEGESSPHAAPGSGTQK